MPTSEPLSEAAAILRHRAHVLRTRAMRTSVRERNALRERAARLERTARILDSEAEIPAGEYE